MMKSCILYLSILGLLPFAACKNNPRQSAVDKDVSQADTVNAVKIDNYWITPKDSFRIISLENEKNTLRIVSCAEYVYSPFGEISDKSAFSNSLLKDFTITNKIETMENGTFQFQILKFKTSRLIYFFDDDPEASKHSDIFKGDINNPEVKFLYGIKIGMDKESFLAVFFKDFPAGLATKCNVIVFESCVQDITHTYTFEANKLKSVSFVTDSYWRVDY